MTLRTIDSLGALSGKRVLVRCDLNVPLKDGAITDDGRIRASVATLNRLIHAGARIVVLSHLGRPGGSPDAKYSPRPGRAAVVRTSRSTGDLRERHRRRGGHRGCRRAGGRRRGDAGEPALQRGRNRQGREGQGDLRRQTGRAGRRFVSDGFGVVHRKQASVYELAGLLPSAAGLLIASELDVLDRLTRSVATPYTVVLGGSKVSDKLGVIGHLLPQVTSLLIGGGMLFTFLAAQGHKVGSSLLEADQLDAYAAISRKRIDSVSRSCSPRDVVVASRFSADAEHVVRPAASIEDTDWGDAGVGLDIGPDTAARFAQIIRSSATVFWNGPMGVFEFPAFAAGTKSVAQALTEVSASNSTALSVVGGGDSAAAVRALGFHDNQFGHISTGGGASLEFLEGKRLPGLEVLGWQ